MRLKIMGATWATSGTALIFAERDSSIELERRLLWTTAMSMPELVYMRSHSCSKAREKPTRATKAPMPMVIPTSVKNVLSRLRQRFFHANPVNESWEAIRLGNFLFGEGSVATVYRCGTASVYLGFIRMLGAASVRI